MLICIFCIHIILIHVEIVYISYWINQGLTHFRGDVGTAFDGRSLTSNIITPVCGRSLQSDIIIPVLCGVYSFLDQVKLEEEPVSPPLSPPAMEENSINTSPTRPPVITDLLIDSYQVRTHLLHLMS